MKQLFAQSKMDIDFFIDDAFGGEYYNKREGASSSSSDSSASATRSGFQRASSRGATQRPSAANSRSDVCDKHTTTIGDAVARLAPLARHVAAVREQADRAADVLGAAFYFQHQIRIAFALSGTVDGVPLPKQRLKLLTTLQHVLEGEHGDQLTSRLSGVTVCIGDNQRNASMRSGNIDSHGRVTLIADESAVQWSDALLNADLDLVISVRKTAYELELLEVSFFQFNVDFFSFFLKKKKINCCEILG